MVATVRVQWPGFFQLELPAHWSHEVEDGVVSIFERDGVGVLQLSMARREGDAPAAARGAGEMLERFANDQGWTDVAMPKVVHLGELERADVEHVSRREYWRVWTVAEAGRMVLATYNCRAEDRSSEVDVCLAIVESLRFE